MTDSQKDRLSNLDRHVQLLEEKVDQLRSSLAHWQQWYLEYSSLKEEVETLPRDPPPHEHLRRIRRDFESKLLTKKEINEILGKNDLKEVDKIVGVLSRRMDYVEQNINSLTKSLETEENRLAAASVVAQPDAATDEESGLPITDIIEELDEDDNVVNYRLQRGADTEPKIVEALKKAGIHEKDLPEDDTELSEQQKAITPEIKKGDAKKEPSTEDATPTQSSRPESASRDEVPAVKKSVSFAEDTKPGHEDAEAARSRAAEQLGRLMQRAKEQEAMDMSSAVIPDNESSEESKLRREMLEYSMSEIGPVVAELSLEEEYSGDEYGEDADWDDEGYEDLTDDEAEDELGRDKRSVITSGYIERMQELEKRLNVQSAFTVSRSETKPKQADEGLGRISVVGDAGSSSTSSTAAPREKKSVSFATQLDIAPESTPQPRAEEGVKERKIAHVGDIVEKATEPETFEEPVEPPKRVSRFKKERAAFSSSPSSSATSLPPGPPQIAAHFAATRAAPPAEPTPPEHLTLAGTIVERPVASDPTEPDEMDDALLYQAASVEYNRLRNQLIQKQGGFAQQEGAIDPETGLVPLDEELGGPKRMSKFKAARLAKLQ